jgi:ubiquilin
MNQLMSLNPQLRSMLDMNPQLREMMQNPDFLRQFSSPEMMQVSWAHVVSPDNYFYIIQ